VLRETKRLLDVTEREIARLKAKSTALEARLSVARWRGVRVRGFAAGVAVGVALFVIMLAGLFCAAMRVVAASTG
jgi:hypothetical protein